MKTILTVLLFPALCWAAEPPPPKTIIIPSGKHAGSVKSAPPMKVPQNAKGPLRVMAQLDPVTDNGKEIRVQIWINGRLDAEVVHTVGQPSSKTGTKQNEIGILVTDGAEYADKNLQVQIMAPGQSSLTAGATIEISSASARIANPAVGK